MSRSMMNSSRAIVWLGCYLRNPTMTDDRKKLSPVSPSLTSTFIVKFASHSLTRLRFYQILL